MNPACGERRLRFVGDRLRFTLETPPGAEPARGWRAFLRTNLGRAALLRQEVVTAHFQRVPLAGASWRDIPMRWENGLWTLELPLTEVGFFSAKAYVVDERRRQHWPDGPDFGVSVHPDDCRTGNLIYCAFARLHGETAALAKAQDAALEKRLRELDARGFTVIPASGKLRHLTAQLPHIFGTLGCRVLHLLPINPTPTTFARFGRYGSPYACQDLTAIDPALVEFDRRTTGLEQFGELVRGVHRWGGKLFLDLVINHTGWGATLWENHPEWYKRQPDGEFESPGAWGNIWRDLVELDQRHPALWAELAEAFLTWCRRGVDGFRCDAGYKVPLRVWQHIVAHVRQEYPETIFLLEGLGGAWEDTERLLTEGGMQWAYSELFQNYTGRDIAWYLDYSLRQSQRLGLYVHYSETHDNPRLAAKGREWSLLRNRLCALSSVCGGYGFTGGVEWLAEEKINVHQCSGLAWGAAANLVGELARLNRLLRDHPCFFDGAHLTRLSAPEAPVFALHRVSAEGADEALVLVNTDTAHPQPASVKLPDAFQPEALGDLLGQSLPNFRLEPDRLLRLDLPPGAAYCLGSSPAPRGMAGDDYRRARAQAAWALAALRFYLPLEKIGPGDWRTLARRVEESPERFLAALSVLDPDQPENDLDEALARALKTETYPRVVTWSAADARRVTLVPAGHWLLVRDAAPFRARLETAGAGLPENLKCIAAGTGYLCAFAPRQDSSEGRLILAKDGGDHADMVAHLRFLGGAAVLRPLDLERVKDPETPLDAPVVLLTNGRGGMARINVDLGAVKSKYDCVLAANLHPDFPVDRHVFVKRVRAWVNADGFISPLDGQNLIEFTPGPPAVWRFVANAGDARSVEIELTADMAPEENATVLRFRRPTGAPRLGAGLPADRAVSLTERFDLEDRNFHWETKHNGGSEHHFQTHLRSLPHEIGFEFAPATDRRLRVSADCGCFHPQPEWSHNLPHPVEQSRGQEGAGDAFSPGWFEIPLAKGGAARLTVAAGAGAGPEKFSFPKPAVRQPADRFDDALARAARAFLARRGKGRTVIAGYPWFLDWGRDTLICARGLLAAGWRDEVRDILLTFARFEQHGTLPNTIHGENVSNRDTTDAPLWFGLLVEEFAASARPAQRRARRRPADFYREAVDERGRTFAEVLVSIAENYLAGTPNGIRVDAGSALVWSPSHFTWMDTNHPAGTPREGYPVEIQALWIRLLRQLAALGRERKGDTYADLANRAQAAFDELFWLEERGWYADTLLAGPGVAAAASVPDRALRSNCLWPVALGLVSGPRARRCVEAARQHLVVPGALRSLAPLPADPPLPIRGPSGQLLNDPAQPYFGRYEGPEDTHRKPAYHNGTAWPWTFPCFCEALVRAYDHAPAALQAARSYLTSIADHLAKGCLGHVPEIIDGDVPHQQRGCDAQAWSVTEALRVWRQLKG